MLQHRRAVSQDAVDRRLLLLSQDAVDRRVLLLSQDGVDRLHRLLSQDAEAVLLGSRTQDEKSGVGTQVRTPLFISHDL
jgi:hypothetical protein